MYVSRCLEGVVKSDAVLGEASMELCKAMASGSLVLQVQVGRYQVGTAMRGLYIYIYVSLIWLDCP